jgi:hypothetical protein
VTAGAEGFLVLGLLGLKLAMAEYEEVAVDDEDMDDTGLVFGVGLAFAVFFFGEGLAFWAFFFGDLAFAFVGFGFGFGFVDAVFPPTPVT